MIPLTVCTATPASSVDLVSLCSTLERTAPQVNIGAQSPWDAFLGQASARVGGASRLAVVRLTAMLATLGRFPTPTASLTEEEDSIFIAWTRSQHYLQAEIFSTGAIEWFYLNLDTEARESGREFPPLNNARRLQILAAQLAPQEDAGTIEWQSPR